MRPANASPKAKSKTLEKYVASVRVDGRTEMFGFDDNRNRDGFIAQARARGVDCISGDPIESDMGQLGLDERTLVEAYASLLLDQ
jgi:hypothetical protein